MWVGNRVELTSQGRFAAVEKVESGKASTRFSTLLPAQSLGAVLEAFLDQGFVSPDSVCQVGDGLGSVNRLCDG